MKKVLIILAAIIAVVAGICYFTFAKNDACRNVIPEDAKAVMVFDGTEAMKQMNFTISDIMDLLKSGGDDGKEDSGIDVLAPMYGFVSNDNYLCGVFALSDADAFEELIGNDGENTIESWRGFKWTQARNILVCFDSGKALVMGPVSKGESDIIRSKVAEWMNQDPHEVPMLSSLSDKKGIMCLRTNLEVLPITYQKQVSTFYKNVDLSKVFFNAAFNVREKSFVLSIDTESEDEEYSKLIARRAQNNRPIQADILQMPYRNPLAFVAFNINGEALYDELGSNSLQYGMMLGMLDGFCNAGKMLQSIDGNVTVAVDDISGRLPKFHVTACVKNTDFLKGAESWGSGLSAFGMECHRVGEDRYLIGNRDFELHLGVRDGILHLASDKEDAASDSSAGGSSLASCVEGKLYHFSLNIDKLVNDVRFKSAFDVNNEAVKEFLSILEQLDVSVGKDLKVEIELKTKQKVSEILMKNIKR